VGPLLDQDGVALNGEDLAAQAVEGGGDRRAEAAQTHYQDGVVVNLFLLHPCSSVIRS
jgi:hypothetical protein